MAEASVIPAEALATSGATILVVDSQGVIRFANRGLDGADGASWRDASLAEKLGPQMAGAAIDALRQVLQAGQHHAFEIGESTPAGVAAWYRVEASPATTSTGQPAMLLVAVDITLRRRAEERLQRSERLLIDVQGVAHLGTWDWDVSEPHAWWSDELYAIYGLTPQEYTPSYEAYLLMVHPDDRQRVIDATNRVFHEHIPYSHDERIFRRDGSMRWLHTWAQPVLDEQGKLVRLVGVCQDVTEQKRHEGAMRAQTLTRALARRLVTDLTRKGQIPHHVVREIGRGIATDQAHAPNSLQDAVDAFTDMGLGNLRVGPQEGSRHTFHGTDLLERVAGAALPTCYATLGYLEGVVATLTGKAALGNEMRCQSSGHRECTFVIMAAR